MRTNKSIPQTMYVTNQLEIESYQTSRELRSVICDKLGVFGPGGKRTSITRDFTKTHERKHDEIGQSNTGDDIMLDRSTTKEI